MIYDLDSGLTENITMNAHFSKDQNSGFKRLVRLLNNECYRGVSNEEIDIKIFK